MDFTSVEYVQIIGGLFMGVIIFAIGYGASEKHTVPLLIVLIPFQVVESRFGTSSMILTYLLGAALLLRGSLRRLPLAGSVVVVLLVYLASMSQAHRVTYLDHALYIVSLGSGFLLFYITYNFVRDTNDPQYIIRILHVLNVLVLLYCTLQLAVGYERLSLGTEELSLNQNRDDQRLAGPFYAVGLTAEYLVLSIFILAYELLRTDRRRKKVLLYGLIAMNFAYLVATGNRGGFLVLLGGGALFLWSFRRDLGLARILGIVTVNIVMFAMISVVVINYTDFNRLYDRLTGTEVQSGVPDTRAVTWPVAWEEIQNKPILGHGPRLRFYDEENRVIPGHTSVPYPHSLYLFLLYTVGAVGLVAFMLFMVQLFGRIWSARRSKSGDLYLDGFVRLGPLLIFVFLVDQIKVEFLRFSLVDYQHLVFCLFAVLCAFADMARARAFRADELNTVQRPAAHLAFEATRQSASGDVSGRQGIARRSAGPWV